jgi:hypothetical protein
MALPVRGAYLIQEDTMKTKSQKYPRPATGKRTRRGSGQSFAKRTEVKVKP